MFTRLSKINGEKKKVHARKAYDGYPLIDTASCESGCEVIRLQQDCIRTCTTTKSGNLAGDFE